MSISQNFPNTRPSLNLNFARSQKLDPRITFTRTSSATRVNSDGLIEVVPTNSPRFDFDPISGECLGLLIEESRANLTTFSEQLDNARWTVSNLTLSSDTTETTAPDGSNNAEKVLETVTNSFHSFRNFNAYGITGGTVYTASIFVKSINKEFVQLVFDDNATTNGGYVNFNLTSGTITASANYGTGTNIAGTITSYPNGWYRLSITSTAGTTGTFGRFSINGLTSGTSGVFPGYAGNTSNGYYIWGAQLEAGAFPTSYIPTTTSAATRSADVANITGTAFSSWYRQDEGTLLCDAREYPFASSTSRVYYGIDVSAAPNLDFIRQWIWSGNTSLLLNSIYTSSAGPIAAEFVQALASEQKLTALTYKANDFARSYRGGTAIVDPAGNLPVSVDRLVIGSTNSSLFLSGHIRRLAYWPARLSNSILQTLTR